MDRGASASSNRARVGHREREMRRRETRVWMAVAVVAAAGLTGLALPAVYFVLTYGCRAPDFALAEQLKRSQWLEVAPPGAVALGPATEDCDDDDEIATAMRTFRTADVGSAVDFYAQRLEGSGWRPAAESPSCWLWSDGQREVSMRISEDQAAGGFQLELSSRTNGGGGWCE